MGGADLDQHVPSAGGVCKVLLILMSQWPLTTRSKIVIMRPRPDLIY